jgi:alkanesulfonate monooxygenase SsuD/methylene tetrahydromethanopterin reductase-like flavin-dependent oxidoreductase (luciferase family)
MWRVRFVEAPRVFGLAAVGRLGLSGRERFSSVARLGGLGGAGTSGGSAFVRFGTPEVGLVAVWCQSRLKSRCPEGELVVSYNATGLDVGIMLPSSSAGNGGRYGVVESAVRAEEIGFDSVWTVDHLAFHTGIVEPVVALSAAAAVTYRVRLAFGVLLAALRHPALIAKQISSLQALSHDRVVLGVGVGGENPSEWAAAGVPFDERGRRTDAFLSALPELVGGQPCFLPAPWHVDVPSLSPVGSVPPVWIGGRSAAAMERVMRYGEGWLGLFANPDGVARRRRQLVTMAEYLARPVPRIGLLLFVNVDSRDPARARQEASAFLAAQYGFSAEQSRRHMVAGTEDDVVVALRAFVHAGVDQFVLFPAAADYPSQYERLALCTETLRAVEENSHAHWNSRPRFACTGTRHHQPPHQQVDGHE